jgi:large subunit ribosomal protein L6
MSRVAKMPITIPSGVDIEVKDGVVFAKGILGTLTQKLHSAVQVKVEDGFMKILASNATSDADAISGTMRALINNMVRGVSQGYEKRLALHGVGFKAQVNSNKLNLQIGFSHPVNKEMPHGIRVECPTPTQIVIKGMDIQVVGQIAAEVRALRPPEPYKGKGIRYDKEVVVLKETKKK